MRYFVIRSAALCTEGFVRCLSGPCLIKLGSECRVPQPATLDSPSLFTVSATWRCIGQLSVIDLSEEHECKKYLYYLTEVRLCILLIPQSNAECEGQFSIVKKARTQLRCNVSPPPLLTCPGQKISRICFLRTGQVCLSYLT